MAPRYWPLTNEQLTNEQFPCQSQRMHAAKLEQAIKNIYRKDSRYEPSAYLLTKEALDFTVQRHAATNKDKNNHIAGSEFVIGFRDYVLEKYGPMSATLLDCWGLHQCSDIGEIVFNLIDEGVFGKQESDNKKDFAELYDFKEAFRAPFRPAKKVSAPVPA